MRKLLVVLGIAASLTPAASLAQMSGNAPSGPAPDIRNSDLGAHDSFSTPDMHDMLLKQRERELSDRLSGQKYLGRSRPAKASELAAGAPVNDKTGVAIARIEQIGPDGVVVSSATGKVKVPADAFGHNKAGVLLDMTRAEFEQIVRKANAGS
ncbi:hypothetical protein [Sphingomonas sp.]|uniref:hypothetical protein n=1 Tax=Sphingomonas sp. TaxID=28214 RepID=UPI0038AAD053